MKPVVTVDNRADLGSRRYFELGGWKPVSWTMLKKAAQTERGTRAPKVQLVLRAAKGDEWLDEGQEFGLDAAAALRTAKKLIRDDLADSVWIDARYSRPFRREGTTSHTLYHLRAEGHPSRAMPASAGRRDRGVNPVKTYDDGFRKGVLTWGDAKPRANPETEYDKGFHDGVEYGMKHSGLTKFFTRRKLLQKIKRGRAEEIKQTVQEMEERKRKAAETLKNPDDPVAAEKVARGMKKNPDVDVTDSVLRDASHYLNLRQKAKSIQAAVRWKPRGDLTKGEESVLYKIRSNRNFELGPWANIVLFNDVVRYFKPSEKAAFIKLLRRGKLRVFRGAPDPGGRYGPTGSQPQSWLYKLKEQSSNPAAAKNPKIRYAPLYRVMYLFEGDPTQLGELVRMRQAMINYRSLKRQGLTVWMVTEKGKFHPVKGAMREYPFMTQRRPKGVRTPEPLLTPVPIVYKGMNLETREHLQGGKIVKLYRKKGGDWKRTAKEAFNDKSSNPAAAVQSRPNRGAPFYLKDHRALWEKVHGSARRIYPGDLAKFARRAADKVVADAPRMRSWAKKAKMPNPGTTVFTGQLIELHVLGDDGNIIIYSLKKAPPQLWAPDVRRDQSEGSLFAFAGMRAPNPTEHCDAAAEEAADLYRAWNAHDKEPRGVGRAKVSRPTLPGAVPAIAVVYRSDKFTPNKIEYIHHFEEGVRCRTDGKVFYVTGGRLRLTERGLEG